jgi:hypothetical protein
MFATAPLESILFFVDGPHFITGQIIGVDGGLVYSSAPGREQLLPGQLFGLIPVLLERRWQRLGKRLDAAVVVRLGQVSLNEP